MDHATSWLQRFCSAPGNEFYAEVPVSFIQDGFNTINLVRTGSTIPYHKSAMNLLLGNAPPHGVGDEREAHIQASAASLYGLIHARYLLTPAGMETLRHKLLDADFGRCPRVACGGQPVLPVGASDRPRESSVSVFCPLCFEIYHPSAYFRAHDGAHWGTTASHLLLLSHPALVPLGGSRGSACTPQVFGFRLHRTSAPMRRHFAGAD
ncbi:unnamed protein product, partial [Phaeothamnion confervicola]